MANSFNNLASIEEAYGQIIDIFTNPDVTAMSYFVIGDNSSKNISVLRKVKQTFGQEKDWIVVDLDSYGNFIFPLAKRLYEDVHKNKIDLDCSIDESHSSPAFYFAEDHTMVSPETAVRHFLKEIKKEKKRVLITIDDIKPTKELKYFANFYQSLIGYDHSVFLLMSGSIENVDSLISDRAASFLARTPKLFL